MSSTVIHLRFGPCCTDHAHRGFDVVAVRRIAELAPLAPRGALIVEAHPLSGLEHVVAAQRSRLRRGHAVVAIRPCPSTAPFWEEAAWTSVTELVPDLRRIVDGCSDREPMTLLRALLGDPPSPSHDGVSSESVGAEH